MWVSTFPRPIHRLSLQHRQVQRSPIALTHRCTPQRQARPPLIGQQIPSMERLPPPSQLHPAFSLLSLQSKRHLSHQRDHLLETTLLRMLSIPNMKDGKILAKITPPTLVPSSPMRLVKTFERSTALHFSLLESPWKQYLNL